MDVNGFHNSLNTLTDIEVVTAIIVIDLDGETIIGVFHETVWFGKSMEHLFLPPIQLWDHMVTVDQVQKQ